MQQQHHYQLWHSLDPSTIGLRKNRTVLKQLIGTDRACPDKKPAISISAYRHNLTKSILAFAKNISTIKDTFEHIIFMVDPIISEEVVRLSGWVGNLTNTYY